MSNSSKSSSQAALRKELAAIDARRSMLLRELHGPNDAPAPRVALWQVLAEHLQSVGGTATFPDLVDAMIAAGHNLGKYPKRTVKAAIASPSLRSVFSITESTKRGIITETVTLRSTAGQIHYATPAPAQAGRSLAASN